MAETESARQNVTFPSNSHEAHGYLATPSSGSGPGIVVIQEWWGLTDHIAGIVDRLAADGFVALAPDLYGGKTTHDADEAGQMMQSLPVDRAARDLAGAVDFLLGRDDVVGDCVGAVGFCMGGAFVLTLAAQEGGKIGAAVAFYPVGHMPEDYAGLQAAVMAHFGGQDDFQPEGADRDLAERIKAGTGKEPIIHVYPAGHAFHNDENLLGTYDADQAKLAWDRTVSFLREELS
ncbi:MAG TPA: dienelactone hydrolase family protein [Acidimicrobiales bacterium]|jgi:carboxymethylenebutenolidase|nr:dienelactone hydrolase family protein [Acidimicrobiales bacterium]